MKLDKYTVGKRYGKALFELAIEEQQTEDVYHQLLSLRNIFQNLPDLGAMLSDHRLEMKQKEAIMTHLLSGYEGTVRKFLQVVFQYNRMKDLLLIIADYENRFNEQQGKVAGTVTTAVPLKDEQKQVLESKIAETLGYQKVTLTETVNPDILGGVIVEANHQVIDGSIKSRLDYLRKQLGR